MRTGRIEWLDYMKGIAIIAVVMGHVAHFLQEDHPFTNLITVFEMPLFFSLSGILAYKTISRPTIVNLQKKAISLLIPFFAVGSTYGLITKIFHFVLFDQYHRGYWFLISLFFCWLCFLSLSKLVTN